eukprot:TRINITY_DN13875_c0_g1_i1.p3 TRINITY_DN13875_c0_g1~~TRINITY_DN13875_c0_g1_i1.p3  ORF type:complete len:147 (+),score=49.50 TRINITY_DN13875_c0_g1_i1:301-741(+)
MATAVRDALRLARKAGVAVVGASPKPHRTSHAVMRAVMDCGVVCTPINPAAAEVLGRPCMPTLEAFAARQREVGAPLGVVCVFRSDPGPAVEEALAMGYPCVWLQQDLFVPDRLAADVEAAQRQRGLVVVEDRCLKVELARHASNL